MADPTAEQIEQRAYELWEAAGRPEDREQEFWHEAERELQNSDIGANPGERSASLTDQISRRSRGCSPAFECILSAVELFALSAILLSLAFARYIHRATA
jgi:Protein of unknown function (DUF2934)